MHLQRAVDGFDVFARSLSIGAETMVMHFEPDRPLHDRYQVDHDFLDAATGREVVTIGRTVNAFFRWEFNSCETLIHGGEVHPIDYANACPDVSLISLHYYFPWAIKALLRWCVYCCATGRRMRVAMDPEPWFAIARHRARLRGEARGLPRAGRRLLRGRRATRSSATATSAHVDEAMAGVHRLARSSTTCWSTRSRARSRRTSTSTSSRTTAACSPPGSPTRARPRPRSTARATSTREPTPSLTKMLRRWVSTVFSDRNSSAAIWRFVRRSPTSSAISRSRSVSSSSPAPVGARRGARPPRDAMAEPAQLLRGLVAPPPRARGVERDLGARSSRVASGAAARRERAAREHPCTGSVARRARALGRRRRGRAPCSAPSASPAASRSPRPRARPARRAGRARAALRARPARAAHSAASPGAPRPTSAPRAPRRPPRAPAPRRAARRPADGVEQQRAAAVVLAAVESASATSAPARPAPAAGAHLRRRAPPRRGSAPHCDRPRRAAPACCHSAVTTVRVAGAARDLDRLGRRRPRPCRRARAAARACPSSIGTIAPGRARDPIPRRSWSTGSKRSSSSSPSRGAKRREPASASSRSRRVAPPSPTASRARRRRRRRPPRA